MCWIKQIFKQTHRCSCYRDNGDKSPPWQGKELVYQEPESIEVLILIQGISSWCLEGYHFQINACPCLLLYERHFKPACLGLTVCLLQAVIISNKYFLSNWYHFSSLNTICMHLSIPIRVITICFFFQRYTLDNITGCGSISNVSLGYLWCNWSEKFLTTDNNSIFCPAHSSIHATFPSVNWCLTLLSQRLYDPNTVQISIRNQKK